MNTRRIIVIAWGVVAAAVLAWGAVAAFNGSLGATRAVRETVLANTQQSAVRESGAIRLHMLARDTKDARDQLDALTRTDVLSIANMIDDVGRTAGVKMKIGDVLSGPSTQTPAGPRAPALHDVVFLVEADGAFPSLMHAILLLEQLPLFSSVQDLELRRAPAAVSGAGGTWRASIHLRALSTTLIPS